MSLTTLILSDTSQVPVFAQTGSVTLTNNHPTVAVNVLGSGEDGGITGTISANGGQLVLTVAQAAATSIALPAGTIGGVPVTFSGPDYPVG